MLILILTVTALISSPAINDIILSNREMYTHL